VLGRAGDIPEAARGTGIETADGFKERTSTSWSLDLHADYQLAVGPGHLVFAVDVFNLFDNTDAIDYDQNTERRPQVLNPDFGSIIAYQEPRSVRLGVRYEF
jgi:outer membrane receptor protein involved in Fe transport